MYIDYKNVNIYQDDVCVLGNVNFHVDEGEFIYIIGNVGTGKAACLKLCIVSLILMKEIMQQSLDETYLKLNVKKYRLCERN